MNNNENSKRCYEKARVTTKQSVLDELASKRAPAGRIFFRKNKTIKR